MRIAHLIESDGPGGAERVVADLAARFTEAGHHAVVFVPTNGEGWLADQLRGSGVMVRHFHLHRALDPGLSARLADEFRMHRIQLAHSHEFSMAFYGAWATWRASVPHVVTMHGGRYHASHLRRRLALRAAIHASRATVAVSNSVAGALQQDLWISRGRFTVIPNGVRLPSAGAATLRRELRLAQPEQLVVAVGNLYPVKGHRYLVEALALLHAAGHAVHVAIAGRGDEQHGLAELATALGVSDRLHLLGLRSDISNLLLSADAFALPSVSEGLPLALLEAMFAGCAIVATDVGDVRIALAQGSAGRLVPPRDPHTMALALGRLLASPHEARALGVQAYRRAAAEYATDRMVERYTDLYRRFVPASRAGRSASRVRGETPVAPTGP